MANKSTLPADVLKSLEESGVKFDDDGNMIEDPIVVNPEDEEELDLSEDDDQEDDESEEDDEDQDEDESEDESDEDTVEDDDDEDDEDEEEETSSLTPRDDKKDEDDAKAELGRLKKIEEEQAALIKRLEALQAKRDTVPENEEDENPLYEKLNSEVAKFKKFREDAFAKQIKREVNRSAFGATFEEIVNSQQWDTFLGETVYGKKRGHHYIAAIESAIEHGESDSVMDVFKEFHSRFLTGAEKKATKAETQKKSLEDLAVPNRSKSSRKPKLSKHDYVESDYENMLNKAERGEISKADFVKFDSKFQAALSKGRVKVNN